MRHLYSIYHTSCKIFGSPVGRNPSKVMTDTIVQLSVTSSRSSICPPAERRDISARPPRAGLALSARVIGPVVGDAPRVHDAGVCVDYHRSRRTRSSRICLRTCYSPHSVSCADGKSPQYRIWGTCIPDLDQHTARSQNIPGAISVSIGW